MAKLTEPKKPFWVNHRCQHPGCREWSLYKFVPPGSKEKPRQYCRDHRNIGAEWLEQMVGKSKV